MSRTSGEKKRYDARAKKMWSEAVSYPTFATAHTPSGQLCSVHGNWSRDVVAPSGGEWGQRQMSFLASEATCLHSSWRIRASLLFFCSLTKYRPLKQWAIRWEVTLIALLYLLSPRRFLLSLSIRPSLFLFLSVFYVPPSLCDTAAYWFDERRDH